MSKQVVTIRDVVSGESLASAEKQVGVRLFEGAWYFDPAAVNLEHLVVTDRTYICPYKGTCYWIDLEAPGHQAQNVAFTYFQVHEGYEFIKDKIAFYAGQHEATVEEQGSNFDRVITRSWQE
ncbi:MAG: DUF427 domain-containing protein [Chloroflexi bacterium]|nr:DUF427 domain-containing protein [Chloroflexota bacterium]MCI0643624.1 DUF427 domain-containing protein [Chloroflexota bacterium]MCI0726842.1 DUF427 domain-containing protein [Chloroflexota bacterium]